ncbi:MAG: C-terminal target protein, partial [Fibrobacteres bacterium]|nr:C-terminal target protein [Fibrobacterota bacterium]
MDEMRLQGATSRFLYRGLFLLCIAIAFLASQSLGATYYWNHNSVLTNDKDFSRSYNWTVNANGTGAFAPSSNDDDFTSGTMDPVWHYIDQDNSAVGSADVTTNSGKMSIKSRGTDVYGTTNEGVFLYRSDIHGNFFASVKIESQTNTSSSANAGFLIANDMTNLSDGGFFELGMTPGGVVQFVYDQTGTQGQLDNFATAGSGLGYPIWLAVAKNGLNVTAYYKTAVGNAWTQIGTAQTSQNTRMRQDVALYATAHNTTTTCTVVFDDFAGGGPINSGFDLSLNGSGANADANATLGSADISANSLDFTGYTGTLKMGGQNGLFGTYYSNASLTGTSVARVDTAVNFDWGGGSPDAGIASTDNFSASWEGFVVPSYTDTYTFYSDHDDGARLWVNNVLIIDTYGTCCGERTSSTISLTAGVRYAIHLSYTESAGNASEKLRWSSATSQIKEIIPKRSLFAGKLTITGTGTSLNMAAGTVTAQDGWIDFAAPSGTQTFVPRSGQTMPNILHSGAGTLQLSTNALTTLGFFQGAGTFDFNSLNVTTAASGTNRGDFQIWNGGTSSFANLGGRTVTVVGNTSITGSNGSLVNLNPGSAWTLNTTGRLTVDYGNLGNCNASGTAGLAFKTTDAGSNSSWTIKQGTFYWNRNDVINTSLNINRIYNWTSNADGTGYRPETSQSDKFESQTLNAGWIWKDLDNSDATGSYALSGGQLLMSARGADVYGASNEFVTFYRTDLTTTGDVFDVTVKITAQSNSDVWGKAGLIMANDFSNLTSGGYAFMAVTPGNNFSFQADVAAPTGQIDPGGTGGGVLTFPCWIRLVRNGNNVSGYYRTSQSNAWTQSNSTVVPAGIAGGTASQVGLFVCSHNTGTTMSVAFDDLEGGGNYMSATDNDLSFNGTGAASDANSQGGGDLLERSIDFTNYTGTFDLGGWNMTLNAGNATFVSGMTLTTNGGGLFFTAASGTQVFTPKSGATYDSLSKSGAGTLQIATNGFTGGDVTQSGGTLDWGTGLSHTVASIATSGSGTMTVGTSGLTINTGKADFSGLGTLNVSAGSSLTFSAATGTQVFTPKSGSTHPAVTKAGAGTLQLSTNPLIARAFTLSGGTLDFNGQNLTTNNSGNFAVTNGTSASFANLGGRTLTVAGSSSFAGTAGSLLDANPATAWTITSTGALTASYAYVANSNASASTSTGVATNSINQGGNLDWNFPTTDFSAWTYTSQINFNTTATGANITNNLTNFPLLVRLDSNNFIFPQADPAGKDIRFADPDGNILSYEIGRWDATLKKAEIWVMVPQIDANSDRDYIDMYWGNSAATALSSGSAVFNSGMNWKGVWHLNQSGAQPSFSDASATGNTATGQGVANGDTSTAIIGYGYKLDGSSKFLTSSVSYSNPGTFTTSCWFKTTTTSGGKLIGFGSSQTGGSGNYDRHTWMDNTGKLNFGVYNGAIRTVSSTSAYNDGAWHLVTSRFGASGEFLYVDGIEVASNASITTAENTTGYWRAGYDNIGGSWTPVPTSFYFNGTLDEVRINHSEQSADWIKFSYYNQKQNSAILSYSNSALSTWSYSSKVYVNTTASGANITADQTSFPLLVRLTQGNFDFTQAKSDGGDLRFTDSTGALLPYEIERFDATNKLADVWVLMPAIKANNNSQWFKMYWGKATATSLSSAASVFQAGNGFLGAWHLHNGSFSDATSYGNTLVNSSTTNQSAANIAGGRTFSSAYMTSPALSLGGTFTVSAWVKPGTPSDIITICSNGNNGANSNGFRFFVNSSATTNGTIHFETGNGAASASTVSASGQVAFAGSWYHLTAVVNRTAGTAVLYNNGVQVVSGTVRTDFGNTAAWTFGKMSTVTFPWVGDEDEPEVSTTLRSADWIKLSYESQKSGSTVVSLGSRPFDFAKSVRFNFNTTATGANVATNVTGIPILVNLSSSNFDFSVTTNSGNDIQFVDKDGTYLYHDVVEWDKANGIGRVWVRVPQVDGNSLADFITLYYGCATCTASPYDVSDSVFSAYRCAYHLNGSNENKGTDATKYKNHLSYTNDVALSAGLTTPLAPYFDGSTGSTGSYAYVNDPAGGELDVGTGDFTIMGWAKTSYTPAASTWVTPFGKENNVSARYGYGMIFDQAGAGGGKAYFEIWSNNTQIKSPLSASALNDGAWHFLVGKKTAAAVELFVDGATRGTTAHALGTLDNAIPFTAGGDNIGSRFQGNVNEVAMAASALSADFIKLSYENQKAGGTLFSTTTFTTASFQKSKVFKLNTSASGANIAGDVYNFPLLLRISGNAVGTATPITDLTQSAGQDIRFLDGDGVTWLDYQIERWDPTAGVDSAEVWVKVPRIYGNSTSNTITMYYQQAASVSGNMPDGQCASCVFSPSNGFAAAWHLNQAGNNTAANYVDATGNGSNGTGVNMVAGTQVSALSAQGQTFNGSSQYINVPSSGTAVAINNKSFTLSGWFNRTSAGTDQYVITQGTGATDNGLHFGFRSTNVLTLGFYSDDLNSTNTYATTGTWQYLTGTFDLATKARKLYINGTLDISGTANGAYAGTGDMYLAHNLWGGGYSPGTLDEFSVTTVVRDSNWIKLSYQNQRRDAAPLFNPSIADFQKSKKYVFNTTKTGANVLNDVTDYPVLVRFTDADGGLLSLVQGGAPDIRFLDGDGKTWLNYQVERWSTATSPDSAEIWVRVPKVDGNSDHDFITMYYQQSSVATVADGQCASCVFDTANGFASTWHLNNTLNDITINANNGTNQGSIDGEGVSSSGRSFSGTAQYATFGNGNSLKNITDDITVEAWLRTSQAAAANKSIIRHGGHFTALQVNSASTAMITRWDGGGGASTTITWSPTFNDGTWQHYVSQYNKTTGHKVYRNGSLYYSDATVTGSLVTTGTAAFALGGTEVGGELYNGKLDEVRVYDVAKDSNWIRLDYETQRRTGNLFWNNRVSPNNQVTLTATAVAPGNISLSWNTPVSDSSNSDSVGLWVKYTAFPDSANAPAASAGSATHVANLVKTDSAYTYPATYPGTYYFALAVRNTNGKWSPFTTSSSDTANLGSFFFGDTVYVDSAIGSDANTCAQAQNPATPKLTISSAVTNCTASDTLVVRVMPGTYANDNSFTKNAGVLRANIVSFDNNSRAILNGSGSVTENGRTWNYTVALNDDITLRQMDVRAAANGHLGIYTRNNADSVTIDGNRIYNSGANVYDTAIGTCNSASEYMLIMNNVIYQPNVYGIEIHTDNRTNIINNVFYGSGGASKGIYMGFSALDEKFTISNNIFYNWNYGIHTLDANNEIGVVSNNLFFLVTTGQEVVGETDAAKVLKDPLFANTTLGNPNAFKLLPGSPAIDAGTATISTGAGSYSSVSALDQFGSARTIGSAPDIGAYEGTGYTPNPT